MGVLLVLQFTAKTYESDTHVVIIHWAFSDAGSTPAASTTLRPCGASGGKPFVLLGFFGGFLPLGSLFLIYRWVCIMSICCGVLRIPSSATLVLRVSCGGGLSNITLGW